MLASLPALAYAAIFAALDRPFGAVDWRLRVLYAAARAGSGRVLAR